MRGESRAFLTRFSYLGFEAFELTLCGGCDQGGLEWRQTDSPKRAGANYEEKVRCVPTIKFRPGLNISVGLDCVGTTQSHFGYARAGS